jgi:putative Mn2+ efflux pump MntP
MNTFTLLAIAVGLSMDAFAVAVASGAVARRLHLPHALRLAFLFGGFQALMPVLGWLAGWGFKDLISGVDHWVAFVLLAFIGGKMMYESFQLDDDNTSNRLQNASWLTLLTLAVATSIDALAVGLSFSVLDVRIAVPAVVIGVVTFFISFFGVYLGSKVGHFLERKAAFIGGLILLGIGAKILFDHVV